MSRASSQSNLQEAVGFVGDLVRQARLVWRLLHDGRVSTWVKLVPVAAFIYLLSPIDLIPDLMLPGLGQLDDVAIVLLSLKMLVDFSPPLVVREHLDRLTGKSGTDRAGKESDGPYIDVPYRVLDEEEE